MLGCDRSAEQVAFSFGQHLAGQQLRARLSRSARLGLRVRLRGERVGLYTPLVKRRDAFMWLYVNKINPDSRLVSVRAKVVFTG